MGNQASKPPGFTSASTGPLPQPPPPGPAVKAPPPGPASQEFNEFDPSLYLHDGKELVKLVTPQVEEFKKKQPSRIREAGLYRAAIELYADKFEELARDLKFAERGKMMIEGVISHLDPIAIRLFFDPKWAEFKETWEKTRKTERDMIGISPGWSEFMKKTRIEKIDKMYEIIRGMKDKILEKAKGFVSPAFRPVEPYDPNSLDERLKRINSYGGRKTKNKKRKHKKRKTRR
jgi:hypothetical protein